MDQHKHIEPRAAMYTHEELERLLDQADRRIEELEDLVEALKKENDELEADSEGTYRVLNNTRNLAAEKAAEWKEEIRRLKDGRSRLLMELKDVLRCIQADYHRTAVFRLQSVIDTLKGQEDES